MNSLKITIYGLFFGMIGTTLGGIVGAFFNVKSKKILSFILEFAAGLMTSIICFELIPSSLENSTITLCIFGIISGIVLMILCDNFVNKKYNEKNAYIKTGTIIFLGLAIHNFPEGLAIGAGFCESTKLGLSLAIAIALHDIPEGMSIALPMKKGGYSKIKSVIYTAISGLSTGIGALFGAILESVSSSFIGFSLAFAAGAMLYVVSCEIIPASNNLYKGRIGSLGNILGIIIGLLANIVLQ